MTLITTHKIVDTGYYTLDTVLRKKRLKILDTVLRNEIL